MAASFCPALPHKPKPRVGMDQAGSGPAGRQTGLTKLPVTSQTFQGPLGVAPPQLAPLQAEHPRQQALTAPLSFHPVTVEEAKGRGMLTLRLILGAASESLGMVLRVPFLPCPAWGCARR